MCVFVCVCVSERERERRTRCPEKYDFLMDYKVKEIEVFWVDLKSNEIKAQSF